MLFVTREKITQHLLEVGKLVTLYQQHDPSFVERVVLWLDSIEQSLQQFRNPLVSFIASERSKIIAVKDGYRDAQIVADKMSTRKATSATASMAITHCEEILRVQVQEIDAKFEVCREKMSQLLAVSTLKNPIPLPPTEPRQAWLRQIWSTLGKHPEAKGMYGYLNAIMTPVDRLQLLDDLLQNMISEVKH